MNLFDGSGLSELYRLVSGCHDAGNCYDILVGHDGEVRIITTSQSKRYCMAGCRFYFKECLHGTGSPVITNQKFLNQLYKNLLYCWEHDMQGAVSQEDINRWQNYSYWLRNSRSHGLMRIRHYTGISLKMAEQELPLQKTAEQQQSEAQEPELIRNN